MTTLLILLFAFSIVVMIGSVLLGARSKKLLISIPILFFCLPVLLGYGIYLARKPIQQGYIFSRLGPLLSLACPPDDLYAPLAEEQLVSTKRTYLMNFAHKYVGNHAIEVVIPSAGAVGSQGHVQLGVSAKFFRANRVVFQSEEKNGMFFLGSNSHGFGFIRYNVPADLPVRKPLNVEITVQGDIESFLRENGTAVIKVVKSSDE